MSAEAYDHALWDEHAHPLIGERVRCYTPTSEGHEPSTSACTGTVAGFKARNAGNTVDKFLVRLDDGSRMVLDEDSVREALERMARSSDQMSTLDKPTKHAVLMLLRVLICNPLGNLFSQPAALSLEGPVAKIYEHRIKTPMDLGTMYLKTQHDKYKILGEVASDLRQVFFNCRVFNGPNDNLTRVGNLLESLTATLWMEWFGKSPPQPLLPHSSSDSQFAEEWMDALAQSVMEKRYRRLLFCIDAPLISDDLLKLASGLEEALTNRSLHRLRFSWTRNYPAGVPDVIRQSLGNMIAYFRERASSNSNVYITLRELISLMCGPFDTFGLSCGPVKQDEGFVESAFTLQLLRPPKLSVSELLHDYCLWLDDILSRDVTPFLEERLLRGSDHSAVWARPENVVWAQPNKHPWWPGMILAGYGVSPVLAEANLARVPEHILRDLLKSRPHTGIPRPSTLQNKGDILPLQLVIADIQNSHPYTIVEFFATHDYGWVRYDSTLPWTVEDPNPKGKKNIVPSQAIAEAKEMIAFLADSGGPTNLDWDISTISFLDIPFPDSAETRPTKNVSKSDLGAHKTDRLSQHSFKNFDAADVECDEHATKRMRALNRVKALAEYCKSFDRISLEPNKAKASVASKRAQESLLVPTTSKLQASSTVDPFGTIDQTSGHADLGKLSHAHERTHMRPSTFPRESLPRMVPSVIKDRIGAYMCVVNVKAPLFAGEAPDAKRRKMALKEELQSLTLIVQKLEKERQEKGPEVNISSMLEKSRPPLLKVGMLSTLVHNKEDMKLEILESDQTPPKLYSSQENSYMREAITLNPTPQPHVAIGAGGCGSGIVVGASGDGSVDGSLDASVEFEAESDSPGRRSRELTPPNELSALPNVDDRRPRARKSEYKGVSHVRGKWIAKIDVDGKKIHIGTFLTQEQAAHAYDDAARSHYGPEANTNFDEQGNRLFPKRKGNLKSKSVTNPEEKRRVSGGRGRGRGRGRGMAAGPALGANPSFPISTMLPQSSVTPTPPDHDAEDDDTESDDWGQTNGDSTSTGAAAQAGKGMASTSMPSWSLAASMMPL